MLILCLFFSALALLAHGARKARWVWWCHTALLWLYQAGVVLGSLLLSFLWIIFMFIPGFESEIRQQLDVAGQAWALPASMMETFGWVGLTGLALSVFNFLVLIPPSRRRVFSSFPGAVPTSPLHVLGSLTVALIACISILAMTVFYSLPVWLKALKADPIVTSSAETAFSLIVFAFAASGLLIARPWRSTLDRLGLIPLKPNQFAKLVGFAVGVFVLMTLLGEVVIKMLFPHDYTLGEQLHQAMLSGQTGQSIGLTSLLVSIGAGVGEELLFRGVLQPVFGVVATACLFALIHLHYGFTTLLLGVLVIGLILGWIRNRYGTTGAIFVHAVYDLAAILSAFFLNGSF